MDKLATFNTNALIRDLNARRFDLRYSWKQVAAEAGVSASTLSRMAQGKDPDIHGLTSLLTWLGEPFEKYVEARS